MNSTDTTTVVDLGPPPRRLLRPVDETSRDYYLDIDNTSLSSFSGCPRAGEYSLVHNRGRDGSAATRYGHAVHGYLERRLKGATIEQGQTYLTNTFATFPPMDADEWRTVEHAINAMEQYERMWGQRPPLSPLRHDGTLLVEVPFRIPLTTIPVQAHLPYDPFTLVSPDLAHLDVESVYVNNLAVYWTGKIDAVVNDNGPALMDHKTTSMLGPTFFKDFELSQQFIGYCYAATKMWPDIFNGTNNTMILDVIAGRKPTKTGIAHEFNRTPYHYTQEQLDEWYTNVSHLVADFVSHLARGFFPQTTTACVGKYGTCQYHEVCTMPQQFRMGHLHNTFPKLTWSPLN